MNLLVRFASVFAVISAIACAESTVPHDQVVLYLVQVDGVKIPTTLEPGGGGRISVEEGLLAEGVDGVCDFRIRFFSGNALGPINGTVPNCKLNARQAVTVKLDMTAQIGIGEHLYVFQ